MSRHARRTRRGRTRVPKVIGSDVELGNLILGRTPGREGTCREASAALLAEIDGIPARRSAGTYGYSRIDPAAYSYAASERLEPPDWGAGVAAGSPLPATVLDRGRLFLPCNGSSCYIDLSHFEVTSPEVRSAADYVAVFHAMLRIARDALHAANERLPSGQRLVALVNNSDGLGHSYGSHISICMTRRSWEDMFERRIHPSLFFLMAFQTSSVVLTGQGKVGSENGRPPVRFQISQRADFFETIVGLQTSYRRPLVNSRDESHCTRSTSSGETRSPELARLHCIFHDQTLCHAATFLKVGTMQLIVAMIEAGWIDRRLLLRSPLLAVRRWSHDPGLRATARLSGGRRVTAVEHQRLFLESARRFVEAGACGEHVPGATEILRVWAETLDLLEAKDYTVLARRLDWVCKKQLLESAVDANPGLDWDSPVLKHLDHVYGSLDEEEGLYWACERDGRVDRLATSAAIERFVHEPPADTRAWTRSMMLRAIPPAQIEEIDWGYIRVRTRATRERRSESRTFRLGSPFGFTKQECAHLIQGGTGEVASTPQVNGGHHAGA
jgi:Pup amidohydrolase